MAMAIEDGTDTAISLTTPEFVVNVDPESLAASYMSTQQELSDPEWKYFVPEYDPTGGDLISATCRTCYLPIPPEIIYMREHLTDSGICANLIIPATEDGNPEKRKPPARLDRPLSNPQACWICSVDPKGPHQLEHFDKYPAPWTESMGNSLCGALELEFEAAEELVSLGGIMTSAICCLNCSQLLREINWIQTSVNILMLKLGNLSDQLSNRIEVNNKPILRHCPPIPPEGVSQGGSQGSGQGWNKLTFVRNLSQLQQYQQTEVKTLSDSEASDSEDFVPEVETSDSDYICSSDEARAKAAATSAKHNTRRDSKLPKNNKTGQQNLKVQPIMEIDEDPPVRFDPSSGQAYVNVPKKKPSTMFMFPCPLPSCTKRFESQMNADYHVRSSHKNIINPFACTHPGCSARFDYRTDLEFHQRKFSHQRKEIVLVSKPDSIRNNQQPSTPVRQQPQRKGQPQKKRGRPPPPPPRPEIITEMVKILESVSRSPAASAPDSSADDGSMDNQPQAKRPKIIKSNNQVRRPITARSENDEQVKRQRTENSDKQVKRQETSKSDNQVRRPITARSESDNQVKRLETFKSDNQVKRLETFKSDNQVKRLETFMSDNQVRRPEAFKSYNHARPQGPEKSEDQVNRQETDEDESDDDDNYEVEVKGQETNESSDDDNESVKSVPIEDPLAGVGDDLDPQPGTSSQMLRNTLQSGPVFNDLLECSRVMSLQSRRLANQVQIQGSQTIQILNKNNPLITAPGGTSNGTVAPAIRKQSYVQVTRPVGLRSKTKPAEFVPESSDSGDSDSSSSSSSVTCLDDEPGQKINKPQPKYLPERRPTGTIPPPRPQIPSFPCPVLSCSKKYFGQIEADAHVRIAHRDVETPYACTFLGCDAKFSMRSKLEGHQAAYLHMPKQGVMDKRKLQNREMDRRFPPPRQLATRIASPSSSYFLCDGCGKFFATSESLKFHTNYRCPANPGNSMSGFRVNPQLPQNIPLDRSRQLAQEHVRNYIAMQSKPNGNHGPSSAAAYAISKLKNIVVEASDSSAGTTSASLDSLIQGPVSQESCASPLH